MVTYILAPQIGSPGKLHGTKTIATVKSWGLQGVIGVKVPDHQRIYCTRKFCTIKKGTHKQSRCCSIVHPPPTFIKGGGGIFYWKYGESQEWGVGFIMTRNGKLKSLYIVGSRVHTNPLILWSPSYCLPHPLFPNFTLTHTTHTHTQTHTHTHTHIPVTSNPTPTGVLSVVFSCFFGWMGDHTTFDVLLYLKECWSESLRIFWKAIYMKN